MLFVSALRELSFEINKNVDYLRIGRVNGKLCTLAFLTGTAAVVQCTGPYLKVARRHGREQKKMKRDVEYKKISQTPVIGIKGKVAR
jgi:hypothetical protein